MALGAAASDVLRSVFSKGLTLTFAGVIVGAAISLVLTPLVAALLYKVSPRDPAIFAGAFAVMAVASLAASFAPAWRAARIDPVQALRD
jgi:putative ABC transport system permease protein